MTDSETPAVAAPEDEQPEPSHPWARLGPEHFRLLRLAPLPTDRASGARPLRFVQFGRVERHSKEQSLLRLSVQLPGQKVRKEQNVLELWLDHRAKEARFGPDSGLSLEPQNRGLGRFLLAQAAAWAKQHCAHYNVESGPLPSRDAMSEDARARRDHCLNAQGFAVDYQEGQLKALYSAPRLGALHSDWNGEKISFVEQLDAAQMLQQADQNLREQDVQLRQQLQRLEQLSREDGGLRFTIACLVAFALFQAGLLIWIATH
ncbi:hypothetical protein SAMN05216588_102290 [Pseudomonas flavescens]|uniref:Uncharacterized protein n=1 Tax=Phytopseudomonas flavescens TaxID=29435 RepID=A0A1G7ZCS2_9GAMM|nr:hypothetical protein [Pseudomonas flavescens]SDH06336.1 hypothetical protein SAMN05216588_102290 [Pseudomonas flavescens]